MHRARSGQVRVVEAVLSLIIVLSGAGVAQQLLSYKVATSEQRPFQLEEVANKIASALKEGGMQSKLCGEESDGLLKAVAALTPQGYAVNVTVFFSPEFQLEQYRDVDNKVLLGFRKSVVWGAYDWSRAYSVVFHASCSQSNMLGEVGSFRDRISLQVVVGVSAG